MKCIHQYLPRQKLHYSYGVLDRNTIFNLYILKYIANTHTNFMRFIFRKHLAIILFSFNNFITHKVMNLRIKFSLSMFHHEV